MSILQPDWTKFPAWHNHPDRACNGADPNLFFSHRHSRIDEAKRICRTCRFTAECRDFAAAEGLVGVYGATTTSEREHGHRGLDNAASRRAATTKRLAVVVNLTAQGHTLQEIADYLGVTARSVSRYRDHAKQVAA